MKLEQHSDWFHRSAENRHWIALTFLPFIKSMIQSTKKARLEFVLSTQESQQHSSKRIGPEQVQNCTL
jgi:hypothetical protein